jgi:IclR family acetate operon transcriptional repressor
MLRMVPHVGMVVTTHESATGPAVLAHLPRDEQIELLGHEPDAAFEQALGVARQQGYFVSEDDVQRSSINVAAPIFEVDGRPVGAVILSAPRDRLTPDHYARIGAMVLQTARELSLARPRPAPSRERADA